MNVTIKGLALAALLTFGLGARQPPPTPALHAKTSILSDSERHIVARHRANPKLGDT